ncbi:hypothetical protein DFJ77DRAFT_459783 [Powellomyces hirtus]|nr:hypothetical protein DFJ77DRAFT_459783 [Powellomyces hirtus]
MDSAEWDAWLAGKLDRELGIDDETFAEYITQLCSEDTMEADERREVIVEFLNEAAEGKPVETVVEEILAKYSEMRDAAAAKEIEEKARLRDAAKEKELEALQSDTSSTPDTRAGKRALTTEEKLARERVLAQYGYEEDEVVETENGEVEFVYKGKNDGKGADMDSALLPKNDNAERVKAEEQAKKAKAAAEHAKNVQRNKELLEKQKQKVEKEKEKKRTQKKEKRRM